MPLFDNLRPTLAECRAVLARRNRMALSIRRHLVQIPDYVLQANANLYNRTRNLYFATFVACIAFMASNLPYLWVATCESAILANSALQTMIFVTSTYLYGFLILVLAYPFPFLLNALAPIIADALPIRKARWFIRHMTFDFEDQTATTIRSIFAALALFAWIAITLTMLIALKSDLTNKNLAAAIFGAKSQCDILLQTAK